MARGTTQITALVARDRQLLRLPLQLPPVTTTAIANYKLSVTDAAAVERWLGH